MIKDFIYNAVRKILPAEERILAFPKPVSDEYQILHVC